MALLTALLPLSTLPLVARAAPTAARVFSRQSANTTTRSNSTSATVYDPNDSPVTPFKLPLGSADTHVHLFNPQFPYAANRSYTPSNATLDQLREFTTQYSADGNPIQVVLVQPSPYGKDNSALLDGLKRIKKQNWGIPRGIAVIDPAKVTDKELHDLHVAGVRGVRVNTESAATSTSSEENTALIKAAVDRIKHMEGWAVQVYVAPSIWRDSYDYFANLTTPIIADHYGGLKAVSTLTNNTSPSADSYDQALNQTGLAELVELATSGSVYIKLSGVYRASTFDSGYWADVAPLTSHLAKSVPGRLIYASDWPHTGAGKDRAGRPLSVIEQFRVVDQGKVLQSQYDAVNSTSVWKRIMVSNPRKLYRFH
ncbi:hypothetical protein I316_06825 [Kwoniella heveanensis BCC8398]|uniref:Amidohydrolase-related domain-containing protein n=1 Tax=Kwoniella heveanensis BCC8398 TaxID=1296120 RepID=A0A1B9GKD3_9TREE|nr:hypothetical protein I316_06825 [Kwoniella heveanensis BCC8398]